MEQIRIGWARRDFTLNEPVHMYGQMHVRIAEGVLDPVFITALCLDGGKTQDTVIFLACDLECPLGIIITPICEAVHARHPEIPETAIVLSGTHTHDCMTLRDTPETTPDGRKIFPGSECRKWFIAKAVEAACEAWENRRPGGIAFGYGFAVVAHSRRTVYFDDVSLRNPNAIAPNGHAVMYGKTNDPQFSHYETGADHFLNALYTVDENGALTGIVCNVPCPSQVSESTILQSADFWTEVREGVRKQFGENIYLLNQCGAGGDMSPRVLHYQAAQRRRMRLKYGLDYDLTLDKGHDRRPGDQRCKKDKAERLDIAERILDALTEVWSWAKKDIRTEVPLDHRYTVLDLPRRQITQAEYELSKKVLDALTFPKPEDFDDPIEFSFRYTTQQSVERRNKGILRRWEEQKTQSVLPMRMHVVRIGDIAFVTNRYEVYIDFQHRLQARSPFRQTVLIQLAGEEDEGYLPTERAAANKGYSASQYCNPVGPDAGQLWVEKTLEILHDMKEREE